MSDSFRRGDQLPEITVRPTEIQLFRYSAATWNSHRVHFDQEYARSEGYPAVLVHSHLHAAIALRAVTDALGTAWRLSRVSYQVRHPAFPGDKLTATARVVAADDARMELALEEHNQDGQVCLDGWAEVVRA